MKYNAIIPAVGIITLLGLKVSNFNSNNLDFTNNIELTQITEEDSTSLVPELLVKKNGISAPITLSELKIKSKIVGNLSFVTYEMLFYNEQDRVLEGNLYFPLAEGQAVSHYELEVNGKMRPGVIVEKEKGRVAFESTVRKQIDPGLVAWTQ